VTLIEFSPIPLRDAAIWGFFVGHWLQGKSLASATEVEASLRFGNRTRAQEGLERAAEEGLGLRFFEGGPGIGPLRRRARAGRRAGGKRGGGEWAGTVVEAEAETPGVT
jgi:hypothetical protein